MSIKPPPLDAEVDVYADWLELLACTDRKREVFLRDLISQEDIQQEEEYEDFGNEDSFEEDLVVRTSEEFLRRAELLGKSYPFFLNETGEKLGFLSDPSDSQLAYVFCLFLSNAWNSEQLAGNMKPVYLREARDLFQVLSGVSASGVCRGPAYVTGWPRPDRSSFLTKLKEAYSFFGDGTPIETTPEEAKSVKDEEIDVISWTSTIHVKLGTMYLLGQVASGQNWRTKSVKDSIDFFHDEWFSSKPVSTPIPAMFIPFLLRRENGEIRRLARKFGTIFDRSRLPQCVEEAPKDPHTTRYRIDRCDEFDNIASWIDKVSKEIRPS
jgi:hypothetical protein